MIRLLFIIALSNISFCVYCQSDDFDRYAKKDFSIGGAIAVNSFENLPPRAGLTLNLEYLLGAHVGFGATMGGGPNYAEISGSTLGLLGLAAWESPSMGGGSGFLLLFIPFLIENPQFHFTPFDKRDVTLSFNLLKFRYIWEDNLYYEQSQGLFVSGAMRFTYTHHYKINWSYSFFAEYSALYYSGSPNGFQAGISLQHLKSN